MSRSVTRLACAICLTAIASAAVRAAAPTEPAPALVSDPALVNALRAHVLFLADPLLRGRGAGTPEDELAARYVAAQFLAAGLAPADKNRPGLDGFLVPVPVLRALPDSGAASLAIAPDGGDAPELVPREEYVVAPATPDAVSLDLPVVFAGYGIAAPEYGWDDYAGLDARGKIVLVFDHEPGENDDASPFRGKAPTRHSLVATKAEVARAHGAAALFVAGDPLGGHPPALETARKRIGRALGRPVTALQDAPRPLPVLYVSEPLAAKLVGGGRDLRALQATLDKEKKPASFATGLRARLTIPVRDRIETTLSNVVGILAGSDEAVLVGAHHDHLGADPDGTVYPGADDNASGVAALIELAKRLTAEQTNGGRSKGRTVVFASFAAEEEGTLGSLSYVAHPVFPMEKTLAALDLDMLGRDNAGKAENARMAIVFWSAQAPWLPPLVRDAAKGSGLDLRLDGRLRFGQQSDHAGFHDAGVPVLFYFTGWHDDYHEPGDTPEKLNLGKTALLVGHLERVLRALRGVRRPEVPFDPSVRTTPPADPYERPY